MEEEDSTRLNALYQLLMTCIQHYVVEYSVAEVVGILENVKYDLLKESEDGVLQ